METGALEADMILVVENGIMFLSEMRAQWDILCTQKYFFHGQLVIFYVIILPKAGFYLKTDSLLSKLV